MHCKGFSNSHVLQETQSVSLHDLLNDRGFAKHYRAISNSVSHLQAKKKDECQEQYDFFSYSQCALKSSNNFLEGHSV